MASVSFPRGDSFPETNLAFALGSVPQGSGYQRYQEGV